MLLLHGYGCSSTMFYNTMKDLAKKFKLYMIDHIGLAHSTRILNIRDLVKTTEEAELFFLEPIEKWMKVMKLDK